MAISRLSGDVRSGSVALWRQAVTPSAAFFDGLAAAFDAARSGLFENLVQPLMFNAGLGNLLEDGWRGTGWLIVGMIEIAVMLLLLRPLERWRPVEPVTDRAAVRTDIVYTLIHRLGLVRMAMFLSVDPLWDLLVGRLRVAGVPAFELDAVWPGVSDGPVASFLLYLVVFDLVNWLIHRAQHRFGWWWSLHALHHSQRQMTIWTDNRSHLLDNLLNDAAFVVVGLSIGVPPGQFIAIVAFTRLFESLSHANARIHFGALEWLLVSPRFHRLHHAIGIGHESAGAGSLGGHNFGVLFSVWDHAFGTARVDAGYAATGIRDQLPEAGGRDYGRGFWRQQVLGFKRLVGRA
jgi:sterol desaturase/sphingolipid hydroxylase (fatty acid hydroxylase superfamily)